MEYKMKKKQIDLHSRNGVLSRVHMSMCQMCHLDLEYLQYHSITNAICSFSFYIIIEVG